MPHLLLVQLAQAVLDAPQGAVQLVRRRSPNGSGQFVGGHVGSSTIPKARTGKVPMPLTFTGTAKKRNPSPEAHASPAGVRRWGLRRRAGDHDCDTLLKEYKDYRVIPVSALTTYSELLALLKLEQQSDEALKFSYQPGLLLRTLKAGGGVIIAGELPEFLFLESLHPWFLKIHF